MLSSFIVYEINCKLQLRESKNCTCLREITDKENMLQYTCVFVTNISRINAFIINSKSWFKDFVYYSVWVCGIYYDFRMKLIKFYSIKNEWLMYQIIIAYECSVCWIWIQIYCWLNNRLIRDNIHENKKKYIKWSQHKHWRQFNKFWRLFDRHLMPLPIWWSKDSLLQIPRST